MVRVFRRLKSFSNCGPCSLVEELLFIIIAFVLRKAEANHNQTPTPTTTSTIIPHIDLITLVVTTTSTPGTPKMHRYQRASCLKPNECKEMSPSLRFLCLMEEVRAMRRRLNNLRRPTGGEPTTNKYFSVNSKKQSHGRSRAHRAHPCHQPIDEIQLVTALCTLITPERGK